MRVATLVVLVVLGVFPACRSAEPPSAEPEGQAGPADAAKPAKPAGGEETGDALATWKGGRAEVEEVERRLREVPQRRGAVADMDADARLDALVERYHRASRALAVEVVLLDDVPDRQAALVALELADRYAVVRRQALLQAYLRERAGAIEIGDEEIEMYYQAHGDDFQTPKTVLLWNIYRHHEDPDDPEATHAFLRSLRERFLGGETFAALAREYSHSETRLRDGRVGRYAADKLPPKLATIVFALDDGEISEPLPVKDGAVLLYVSDTAEGSELSLDEARPRLENLLRRRALDDEVAARVSDLTPPDGSTILAIEALENALEGDDRELEVLVIGEFRTTVGEFARFMTSVLAPADLDPEDDSEEATRARLVHAQRRLVEQALLYGELVRAEDGALTVELRGDVEEQLGVRRDRMIADGKIRERIEKLADADEARLRSFYDDNRHHFQSPLRFRLREIVVAVGDDPIGEMTTLEQLRERLMADELTLEAAATEVGGEVVDLEWKEPSDLGASARTYVLELGGTGFAIPYAHEEEELHLLQIQAREEPHPLPFDEVRERVRDEYLRRHQRVLSEQVTEEILIGADYRFHEENVRQHLAPPS